MISINKLEYIFNIRMNKKMRRKRQQPKHKHNTFNTTHTWN